MDLKSYLDTLPADQTPNLEHEMKFPWNIRFGIGFWKLINLNSKAVVTGLPRDQLLERGEYLVEGPGHCGECHTPRNLSGGLDTGRWLAGAPSPDGEGKVPNITPSKTACKAGVGKISPITWNRDLHRTSIPLVARWSRCRRTWRCYRQKTLKPLLRT